MAEMLLAKDHHVIETIPPDRSDQPLRESITKSVAGSVRAGASRTVGLLTSKQELVFCGTEHRTEMAPPVAELRHWATYCFVCGNVHMFVTA